MPQSRFRHRIPGSARVLLSAALLLSVGGVADATAQTSYPPPYIPTPEEIVETMLELGGAGSEDVVYDLGSGDGRIVVAAAKRGARAVGIEYDPALVRRSWAVADSAGVADRVDFREGDLFDTDLRDASLVTLYLSADFNLRLRPRLLDQLRPGSRIVSHAFHLGEWAPDSTVTLGEGAGRATLFVWTVPADVDGFWSLEIEQSAVVAMELRQTFQRLDGELRRAGRALAIADGEVAGDSVTFTAVERVNGVERELRFRGALRGAEITGVIDGPGAWSSRRWRAIPFSAGREARSMTLWTPRVPC